MIRRFKKYPDERKRYGLDYSDWLDASEQILSVAVQSNAAGGSTFVVESGGVSGDGKKVVFYVEGGTPDEIVVVSITIHTTAYQTKEDFVRFKMVAEP